MDELKFWRFLESTQAEACEKLHYKPDWKKQVVERLHRKLKKDGVLALLKKGLDVEEAHFDLLYRLPYNVLNPEETLFEFRRCLVHFAVDPDEVWMTTKLEGPKTYFLPFNKGHHHGKGNPPDPLGQKTAYLWKEILNRHSLCNIIEHYAKYTDSRGQRTCLIR